MNGHSIHSGPPSETKALLLLLLLLPNCMFVHSKLRSITHVATKMYMTLRSFVMLTWMRGTIELVYHVTL